MQDPWDGVIEAAVERVRALQRQGPQGDERALVEGLPPLVAGREAAFLAWAQGHPAWSLTLAECASEVCAKPREAAIYLLRAIAREVIEDDR